MKQNYFCSLCGVRNGWYPRDGAPNSYNRLSVVMRDGGPWCPVHNTKLRDRSRSRD